MSLRSPIVVSMCLTFSTSVVFAQTAENITLSEKTQIPEKVLAPGNYTISVEDRLPDRAIVRITDTQNDKHYFVLSVPSDKLPRPRQTNLVFFRSLDTDKQVLRGWLCPDCAVGLEFVYPKVEAAKIVSQSAGSVLAVDPDYDKVPVHLSPDDMKVVTLWLLAPQRVTADNRGKGIDAARYVPSSNISARTPRAQSGTPVDAQGSTSIGAQARTSADAQVRTSPENLSPTDGERRQAISPGIQRRVRATVPAQETTSNASGQTGIATIASNLGQQSRRHLPRTASDIPFLIVAGLLLTLAAGGLHFARRRV